MSNFTYKCDDRTCQRKNECITRSSFVTENEDIELNEMVLWNAGYYVFQYDKTSNQANKLTMIIMSQILYIICLTYAYQFNNKFNVDIRIMIPR